MLRKRTRSIQKDHQMVRIPSEGAYVHDVLWERQKTNSFFNVPDLFVGLSPQVVSDCDSVRSPTSPLDFKLFSNLGNSFRFPKPSLEGHQKSWGCNKVGLGSIVDSVDDSDINLLEKLMRSSSGKSILFGPQVKGKAPNSPTYDAVFSEAPKSLPKNYGVFPYAMTRPSSSDVFFEIGEDPLELGPFGKIQSFSLDSKRQGSERLRLRTSNASLKMKQSSFEHEIVEGALHYNLVCRSPHVENNLTSDPMPVASGSAFAPALTASEIELSEDYTCVISHGPNPKATHIFGDCVLGCHLIGADCGNKKESSEIELPCLEKSLEMTPKSPYTSDDFLSYCCFCNKKLEEGTDIYMYRGEKAFCSSDCRLEWISIEEDKEKSISKTSIEPSEYVYGDGIFEKSMFVAM